MSFITYFLSFIQQRFVGWTSYIILNFYASGEMKIARVIPLFKSSDKSLFTNYNRPVSVFTSFL